jgi:DNA-binding NarL/FixJ family response regulator
VERPPIRILLADDQILFVNCLKYVLESMNEKVEIVGVAEDGLEAIKLVENLHPDLVLMDVRMPKMDGVEATRILHAKYPDLKIVMLTTFGDDEYVHFAVKYGAAGYLLKNMPPEDLLSSIKAVMAGATLFSKEVSNPVADVSADNVGELTRCIETLSAREMEVLGLIMETLNNKQISEHMGIAQQSVRNYVHQIYSKFDIFDRLELIRTLRSVWRYYGDTP